MQTDYHNKRYINKTSISLLGDMLVRLYELFFQYMESKIFDLGYNDRF